MLTGSPPSQQPRAVTAERVPADGMVRFLSKSGLPPTIVICPGLSAEERTVLAQAARVVKARRGRIIYHQGDSPEGLFLLEQGKVRLSQWGRSGKEQELAILDPGAMFGDLPLLGQVAHRASAEVLEDCTLGLVEQRDMERLLLAEPRLAVRLLEALGRYLADAEHRLRALTYASVPDRVVSLLLRMAVGPDQVIEGISHQEFADMVGAYRETITKILGEFQAAGYLELARRHIRLLDRGQLAATLDEPEDVSPVNRWHQM
jgi:CRP/FNR family transcriptional regulator, cyclic AMP receptor protein